MRNVLPLPESEIQESFTYGNDADLEHFLAGEQLQLPVGIFVPTAIPQAFREKPGMIRGAHYYRMGRLLIDGEPDQKALVNATVHPKIHRLISRLLRSKSPDEDQPVVHFDYSYWPTVGNI